jgi:1-acyl-sn-glycerol-3-phosphate acyltransferase
MMKRFGNIPVPKEDTPAALRKVMARTKAALDDGVSIIAFPEGTRTTDGRVGPFKSGVFRMAIQFGYPIAPMSVVGAYEFSRKGSWMLYPSKIVVHMHDTIETKGMRKQDADLLVERVHSIVSAPVDESFQSRAAAEAPAKR